MHKKKENDKYDKMRNVGAETRKKRWLGGLRPRRVGAHRVRPRRGGTPKGGGAFALFSLCRSHFRSLVSHNSPSTKIPQEDPQREKKRAIMGAGEGRKKGRNFGRSGGGGPAEEMKKKIKKSKHRKN